MLLWLSLWCKVQSVHVLLLDTDTHARHVMEMGSRASVLVTNNKNVVKYPVGAKPFVFKLRKFGTEYMF